MQWFRHSLVARISAALLAVTLLALINIAASIFVSESAQGDAAAINQSGALRMETQRMASLIQRHHHVGTEQSREAALSRINAFPDRLHNPQLRGAMPAADHPLGEQYDAVRLQWLKLMDPLLRSQLDAPELDGTTLDLVESYVDEIHTLVSLLENRTESKIKLLGIIQGLSLLITLAVVAASLMDFRRNVVFPLRRLVTMARAASRKDFSLRSHASGKDELSLLGQTFDRMASELSASYQHLEARAAEKTRELERSHRALQLLHNASRSLYGSNDLCQGSVPLLQQLESLLDIGPVSLYLHDREGDTPFQAVTTFARERPDHCRSLSCTACLTGPDTIEDQPSPEASNYRLLLPVRTGQDLVGTLEVWYPEDRHLEGHERQLLETLADQLATAVYLQRRMTEEQRLTLMEERAVIARELHDSLAQSLSYLKMQVARLQRLQTESGADATQQEVVGELRNGLNNAYRQLRELLTTFRLKFDSPGLYQALRQTADEFSERLGFPVQLNFELPPQALSPNEEIHILQIVREALANTVKHAGASEVSVDVTRRSGKLRVCVRDNGRGLPEGGAPPSHYGLVIMRDRSMTLGGDLTVHNRPEGGTEVLLTLAAGPNDQIITQAS